MHDVTDALLDIVCKLKAYRSNLYKLTPIELAEYIKIKGNFIKQGIILTDEKLEMPEKKLVAYIKKQQVTTDAIPDVIQDNIPVSEIYSADVTSIDKERVEIRKYLFDDIIVVKVTKAGRAFSMQWNNKMTTCRVNIPSNWGMHIEQALLLDLYEDQNGRSSITTIKAPMTKMGTFVFDLLSRHSDYSIIKRIMELEYSSCGVALSRDLDKKLLNRLQNKGFSVAVAILIVVLAEQVSKKAFSLYSISRLLSYRTRLVNEVTDIVSVEQ